MSKPSKNIPIPINVMMRVWNGPIGSRSRRLPALTEVAMYVSPPDIFCRLKRSPALYGDRAAACYSWFALVQSSLGRRVAVPVERLIVGRDHHALGVEMIFKTFGAEFAPQAAVADAAPGRCRVEPVMVVDPDDAGLDRGSDAMGAADVAGADR